MNEPSKITSDHLRRSAIVYIRQSSATQVEHNRESTARQYQSTALNTARTGSISAFQLSQQFGSFGLGSGFSHDFAPLHRLTLAFGHACRTIR